MTKKGFTLLEVLVVLMILGFLTAMTAGHFSRLKGEAAITTSLNEMKNIKEVIRDRFYPDLGLIPEDLLGLDGLAVNGDEIPECATRFLCLKNDGDVTIGWNGANFVYTSNPGVEESLEMAAFLAEQLRIKLGVGNESLAASQAEALLKWDKYSYKGWRGLYMEQEEYYDYDGSGGSNIYWPIIVNPWADRWEEMARKEETQIPPNPAMADYYRSMKGYRIFGRQNKNLAQIVSYGANGKADCNVVVGTDVNNYVCVQPHTPVAANRPITGADWPNYWAVDNTQSGNAWAIGPPYESFDGDDLVMFIFGTQPVRRP